MEADRAFTAPLARLPCAVNILGNCTRKPFREMFLDRSYLLINFSLIPSPHSSGKLRWKERGRGGMWFMFWFLGDLLHVSSLG